MRFVTFTLEIRAESTDLYPMFDFNVNNEREDQLLLGTDFSQLSVLGLLSIFKFSCSFWSPAVVSPIQLTRRFLRSQHTYGLMSFFAIQGRIHHQALTLLPTLSSMKTGNWQEHEGSQEMLWWERGSGRAWARKKDVRWFKCREKLGVG